MVGAMCLKEHFTWNQKIEVLFWPLVSGGNEEFGFQTGKHSHAWDALLVKNNKKWQPSSTCHLVTVIAK
jgi:hypothetical protein